MTTMNSNNLFQALQKGFRVTIGATASLVETMQDPQKREATFSEFRTEFDQKSQEWAEKGEKTEQDARQMLDDLLKRQGAKPSSSETTPSGEATSTSNTATSSDPQAEVQELTERIIALRKELEELRQDGE